MQRLPGNVKQRVRKAIDSLIGEPHPPASKQLEYATGTTVAIFRLRIDNWRIVYAVDTNTHLIRVVAAQAPTLRLPGSGDDPRKYSVGHSASGKRSNNPQRTLQRQPAPYVLEAHGWLRTDFCIGPLLRKKVECARGRAHSTTAGRVGDLVRRSANAACKILTRPPPRATR
jgi:mRNA-degrading endonuclease RelE of RelBE toxin-antitoxin system